MQGTGEAASCFVAATEPLEMVGAFLRGCTLAGRMDEDKTTSMMTALFQWLPGEIFKVSPMRYPLCSPSQAIH